MDWNDPKNNISLCHKKKYVLSKSLSKTGKVENRDTKPGT